MKEPKRVKKALDAVEEVTVLLEYYMGSEHPEFTKLVKTKIKPLVMLIKELSTEQKIQNAKLAKLLKKSWKRRLEDDIPKKLDK